MKRNCTYLKKKLDSTIYCKFLKRQISLNECIGCPNKTFITTGSSKRTKELSITKKVKMAVWERDNHRCIFCGCLVPWNLANSHFIKRSHGGKGIEENILTNCEECHKKFDDSPERVEWRLEYAERYLRLKYPNWNIDDLIYKK